MPYQLKFDAKGRTDLITLGEVKKEHRERMLMHIFRHALQDEPNSDELYRINVMLDQKKTIAETLAVVRQYRGGDKRQFTNDDSIIKAPKAATFVNQTSKNRSYASLRTPLEKHFYEYISV